MSKVVPVVGDEPFAFTTFTILEAPRCETDLPRTARPTPPVTGAVNALAAATPAAARRYFMEVCILSRGATERTHVESRGFCTGSSLYDWLSAPLYQTSFAFSDASRTAATKGMAK